jgi:hypothetical protein
VTRRRYIMPYCPVCRDEYQRGISQCPYCGANLVDRLENATNRNKTKGKPKIPDLVRLRDFPSSMYAYMLQGALENEGIPSVIKDEKDQTVSVSFDESSSYVPDGGVTIWVPKKNQIVCKEIADQMFEDV